MTTPADPPRHGLIVCVYCTPRRSPVDGRVFRDCSWCLARRSDTTCECTYCVEWLDREDTDAPHRL